MRYEIHYVIAKMKVVVAHYLVHWRIILSNAVTPYEIRLILLGPYLLF